MKAIGYARVSTQDQKLDAQIEQIKRYCEYRNIDLARLYTDKASGANTDRPEFQTMIGDIETNAHNTDLVIVWKLDRIGRSLKNLIEIVDLFKSKELGFICINANIDTTSNEGRLFFHMMASFAEYERALINERTALGREAALAKGIKFGRPIITVDINDARRRIADGVPKTKVAGDMGISRSTLHRRLTMKKACFQITQPAGDIICPWCGYAYMDSHDYTPDDLAVPGFDVCPECGKEFQLDIETCDEYTLYSTYRRTHKQEA